MKPPETNFHHLSGLQPLRGGENLVFDPGRTQRRSAQGRRVVSAMCNVELPNNAGKTLENPGNSTQKLGLRGGFKRFHFLGCCREKR
jgi:hypothetical protein